MSPEDPEPFTTQDRLPVLMYHRVGPTRGAWERRYGIEAGAFRAHMLALRTAGYRAISLSDCAAWLAGASTLPKGAVLISFDDGFQGVHEHAVPLLSELGWPAAMFLVTGHIGQHDEWSRNEHPRGQTYPLLSWPEIRAMQAEGWEFGSHSVSHADLAALPSARLAEELAVSRKTLEDALATRARAFAYPYGRLSPDVMSAVRAAGYQLAFSTRAGFNRRGEDPLLLRRIDVLGTDSAAALLRKVALGSNDGSLLGAGRYLLSRASSKFGAILRGGKAA